MNNLYAILPCFNEAENIVSLIEKWINIQAGLKKRNISSLEIVVVDDGSTDGTCKVVKEAQGKYGQLHLILHEKNQGLGAALMSGLNYVLPKGSPRDFVCIMDADNTHNPTTTLAMLDKQVFTNADCVIASRYEKGAQLKGVTPFRQFLSVGARLVYSYALRIPGVKDYTCGYRLYKLPILKSLILRYDAGLISEKGFTCMVELLYKLHLEGGKITEVPFELQYDLKNGASKMRVFRTILQSLGITFKIKKNGLQTTALGNPGPLALHRPER